MSTVGRAARRVATTAGLAEQALQNGVYRNQASWATANWLEQAAEVLCVLAFFPLSETSRIGFFALLERRLGRAYEGATR
jgi:hypothetical protein